MIINQQQQYPQMQIKRTQQFVYLQQKASHYHNLRTAKPSITTFRSPPSHSPQSQLQSQANEQNPSPHRNKRRSLSLMEQYNQQRINQNLVNCIIGIRNGKARVQVQGGYSRYNFYQGKAKGKGKGTYGKFREEQRCRSIQYENYMLGEKILRVKPSIGTISDWNHNYQLAKSHKKLATKSPFQSSSPSQSPSILVPHNDQQSPNTNKNPNRQKQSIPIYSKNKFIPQYYRTFMERDGSTVAIKEKMFQLPRVIADQYYQYNGHGRNGKERTKEKKIQLDLDFRRIMKDTSGQLPQK